MKIFNAQEVAAHLQWQPLIDSLSTIFSHGCQVPVRHHHTMELAGQSDATMLIMPAWIPEQYAGVKIVNVFPDNPRKSLPTIMGQYLLMDGASGASLALLDGAELTARRTVAASALASRYLSREESSKLFIAGSGRIARYLGLAHAAVRPIREIKVWSRSPENAAAAAQHYSAAGFTATSTDSLEQGTAWADIISCATLSQEPLIRKAWVRAGSHIDLVGAFKPMMRESDTELICRASVFVDTRSGTLAEAGDLLIPIREGRFEAGSIRAELEELIRGLHGGRLDREEITLFKSVGAAQEDLAAAICCYEHQQGQQPS
ncbi:bifunctional Delta(1)-pyrroline-2-carboxylate/Delta(1)-piperideine-2-carboxylate reductase [Desulfogranum mediterraneum]|uniref:ornithine cyclodeaminase family protein n=1 Tax=Desulfogranum mediterraneum TaxID=160661 RepID=UPI00041A6A54|nr:ornithine cyclodeaminase family protein [Desulfogranum mediterraneum]